MAANTANTDPIFTNVGNKSRVKVNAISTNRNGSGTSGTDIFLLASITSDGTRIETIDWNHYNTSVTQASIAAVGRIYLSTDATNPTAANTFLQREIALTAVIPSTTAIGATFTMTFSPALVLPAGVYLYATMSVLQTTGGYDVVLNGYYFFNIVNETQSHQYFNATLKLCSDNGKYRKLFERTV